MKRLILCLFSIAFILISIDTKAQFLKEIKEKIKQKAAQRADAKIDNTIDKGLNKVDGTDKGNAKQSKDVAMGTNGNKEEGIKTYSKYDFIPGDKILYSEDFSQDVVGEFPLYWNTNGTGEIVTMDNIGGKWLQLKNDTRYVAGMKNKFPENVTVEFDLLAHFNPQRGIPPYIYFTIISDDKAKANSELNERVPGLEIYFRFNANNDKSNDDDISVTTRDKANQIFFTGENSRTNEFTASNELLKPVHVAIWIQKQRVRIWMNQNKVFDAPKVIPEGMSFNKLRIEEKGQQTVSGSQYLVSNFKVGEATPDTRSKLITEGKWSTNGILFDVNSDQIKPSSFSILKEIATTLSENPTVRVKIIGHTDSDGDHAKNLDLSKRRAISVKAALAKDFSIDETRMETDGMGDTKPVADNKTAEGKAQNRRVEFVKL